MQQGSFCKYNTKNIYCFFELFLVFANTSDKELEGEHQYKQHVNVTLSKQIILYSKNYSYIDFDLFKVHWFKVLFKVQPRRLIWQYIYIYQWPEWLNKKTANTLFLYISVSLIFKNFDCRNKLANYSWRIQAIKTC